MNIKDTLRKGKGSKRRKSQRGDIYGCCRKTAEGTMRVDETQL
jgi:hypothetical protein